MIINKIKKNTTPKKTEMLDMSGRDLQSSLVNMSKELKETMHKKLKEKGWGHGFCNRMLA
jgi:hypothetical protein